MVLVVVPIAAATAAALIAQADAAKQQGADLVEVRLDRCGAEPANLVAALPALALPYLLTVRHASEGGDWRDGEAARIALYQAAVAARAPAYVDVELAHWPAFQRAGFTLPTATRLILSYHDFTGLGEDLEGRIRSMYAAGATVAKVAITARDSTDLALIERLYRWERRPLVALAMGEHGLPSRLLAGCWGAHLTFARLDDDAGSAPGQPTVRDLLGRYRLRSQGPATAIYGVIGSPIAHSLSPLIHNLAFQHTGRDAVYVPFRVEDAPAFWQACGAWIAGLSVTIPHKHVLQPLMDGLEDLAAGIGAMNTVWRDQHGKLLGANTDAEAIRACLLDAGANLKDRRVLVLGAGGVARAAVFSALSGGAKVTIANRTPERAEELAAESGASAVAWESARGIAYDILINGTAVGMRKNGVDPDESPWPGDAHRPGTTVFDTVYVPLETRFLRDAQMAGCRTICGLDMFICQAVGQFHRWTGLAAPEPLMRRAALEQLERR